MEGHEIIEEGPTLDKAASALILLHGRGGRAQSMLGLAHEFCDESFYIVAPQAPNGSWYPHSFMADEASNQPFLSSSIALVKNLIDLIAVHLSHNQIYLMGFSQGACLALETSARFAESYGAVIAFSGGLIGSEINNAHYRGDFNKAKIFIGISEEDPHIPLVRAKDSQHTLEQQGAIVKVAVYPGSSHTIREDEIKWVKKHAFS